MWDRLRDKVLPLMAAALMGVAGGATLQGEAVSYERQVPESIARLEMQVAVLSAQVEQLRLDVQGLRDTVERMR